MNPYYWLGYHLSRLIGRVCFRLRIIHRERMIQTGPVILAMNHQSYLDPPLAGIACDRAIYFLARKTLMDVPLFRSLLPKLNVIPVNQEGIDRSALKALIRVLKSGNAALVFPEGARTLDGNLQPAQPPSSQCGYLVRMKLCRVEEAVCTLFQSRLSLESRFFFRKPISNPQAKIYTDDLVNASWTRSPRCT